MMETVISALTDEFKKLRPYKMWLTLVVSIIFYFVGLSMCTQVFFFMNLEMPLQSRYFHKSERAKQTLSFRFAIIYGYEYSYCVEEWVN